MAKTNIVPPTIPSGFKRRKDAIFAGLAFLTVVYGLVIVMFEDWVSVLLHLDTTFRGEARSSTCFTM
jgi:hypothetical protein